MKTLSFNTNRGYSDKGQRIVAAQLDNGYCSFIVMVDLDRGIDACFDSMTDFTQSGIMRAYDNSEYATPLECDMSYEEYYAILKTLKELVK